MKRRTKQQKFNDIADAYQCIKEGKPVKRSKAKDGSIPTHPVVEVVDLPEYIVLKQCMEWLKKNHIFCNRHDCGSGDLVGAGMATYGIRGAGDIVGLTPYGLHFEIECKRGKGGRLSEGQQKRMKNIRENHGLYFIVHSIAELEFYFQDYLEDKSIGGSDL